MGYYTDFHGSFELTGKEDVLAGLVPMINAFSEQRHHAPGKVNDYHPDMPRSFWCDWEMSYYTDRSPRHTFKEEYFLGHNGSEKFYCYTEWLQYLIDHFFAPNEVMVNGEVEWVGESPNDRGKIVVKDNVMKVLKAKITYVED